MEEFYVFVAVISEQAAQFTDELVCMREVGGAEVLIEGLIHEFLDRGELHRSDLHYQC